MKRYLIFAFDDYEAQGGMGDCTRKADTLEEARRAFEVDKEHGFDNVIIYDLEKETEVWSLDKEPEYKIVIKQPYPWDEMLAESKNE